MESATACCVVEVPVPIAAVPGPCSEGPVPTAAVPGPGSEVPGPGATTAVPGPVVEVPVPPAGFLQSDPAAFGAGGTKIESDSGDGLMDGLRRR